MCLAHLPACHLLVLTFLRVLCRAGGDAGLGWLRGLAARCALDGSSARSGRGIVIIVVVVTLVVVILKVVLVKLVRLKVILHVLLERLARKVVDRVRDNLHE